MFQSYREFFSSLTAYAVQQLCFKSEQPRRNYEYSTSYLRHLSQRNYFPSILALPVNSYPYP